MNAPARFTTRERIATRDALGSVDQTMRREIQFEIRAETTNAETRTVELSFSSEEPYERWWGTEILDHGPNAVRLGRLNGGAALLVNHDTRDQVGVVETASITGRRGRATVRFGRSTRAEEVYQDVLDGIRRLVSVGYRIIRMVLESTGDAGEVYRVVEWEPYEISIVAIPADATVGVDRESDDEPFDPRSLLSEEDELTRSQYQRRDGAPAPAPVVNPTPTPAATVPAIVANPQAERDAAVNAERERVSAIIVLGARLNCRELAERAVNDGSSIDAFVRSIEQAEGPAPTIRTAEAPTIGLTDREARQFSFLRAIYALANPTNRAAQEAAAFEFECSAAAAAVRQTESQGLMIPVDVLRTSLLSADERRDLVVGTATAGGNLVATNLLGGSFIELLRNSMVLPQLGARLITDLNGNLAIPRQTGAATAYWVGENAASTESQQTVDQVALAPKTVGAFTDIGRQLMLQSSIDVEAMVRADLATVIALAIDLAGIHGSGSANQPRGVINTSGIGSVALGANGDAITMNAMIDLETAVAVANAALGSLGYATNAKVVGALKKLVATTGAFLWTNNPNGGRSATPGEINGYPVARSNQISSALTKGSGTNLSATVFGNWADLIIGMWGGLDLLVDPYTGGTAGTVRVSVLQSVDVAVRHPASFAAITDIVTG
ncbi:major capsid protein [Rhizorhabdus wittichii DC-6]|nr:major capsid protein [Rhizorhabdus wittichii DC-6]